MAVSRLMPAVTPLQMSRPMSRAEQAGVRSMAFAIDEFEPFPAFVIRPPILRSLIDRGLVECGSSSRPAVAPHGFRLTKTGRAELRKVWGARLPKGPLSAP